jgi:hypothetical protein
MPISGDIYGGAGRGQSAKVLWPAIAADQRGFSAEPGIGAPVRSPSATGAF